MVAFFDCRIISEQHDADFAFFKIEGHTGDAATELDHLVEHDVRQAFHLGDTVTDLSDGADVSFFDRRGDTGDLLFKFLEDATHKKRLLGISVRF